MGHVEGSRIVEFRTRTLCLLAISKKWTVVRDSPHPFTKSAEASALMREYVDDRTAHPFHGSRKRLWCEHRVEGGASGTRSQAILVVLVVQSGWNLSVVHTGVIALVA